MVFWEQRSICITGTRLGRAAAVVTLLASLLCATPGCGVFTLRFLDQEIRVTSLPQGAQIFVDGRPSGQQTPGVVRLERNGNHTIWVDREGYQRPPNQLVIRRVRDWIVAVDLAFSVLLVGFLFLVVDDQLGSDSDLEPGELHFELRPLSWRGPSEAAPAGGLLRSFDGGPAPPLGFVTDSVLVLQHQGRGYLGGLLRAA